MARYSSTSFPSWYVGGVATLASLLIIILGFFHGTTTCSATRIHVYKKASTNFITAQCSATSNPRLCIDSLSAHASTIQDDPSQLAQTAISVCLADAQGTSAALSGLSDPAGGGSSAKDAGAVSDCKLTMGDCVGKLQKSLAAMGRPRGKGGLALRMNDVQTWLSTALTDVTACKDGLVGGSGSTEKSVNDRMANTEELTSIALALVNGLSSPSP